MELSPTDYDFGGWATCCNQLCSDGRTIMPDAFKHQDGDEVPLVWNHRHDSPEHILGTALLHSVDGSMYVYGKFNDTETGQLAKKLVESGNIVSLSICANQLKQSANKCVTHGIIREVSLVLAGANPTAKIEDVIRHGEIVEDEAIIYMGESLDLYHSDEQENKEDKKVAETKATDNGGKTIGEIFNELTEDQKTAVCALVGMALESSENKEDDEGGNEEMKHNVFDQEETLDDGVLTHADQMAIIELAKKPSVGSLKEAFSIYAQENGSLEHAGIFEDPEALFPEYELLKKGEPETLERDQSWIDSVLRKIHKSPISRVRTRQADARIDELRAKGYQKKGDEKTVMSQIKLMGRTTDPQTIYVKGDMHRDDIIDITDFDVVEYQWRMMRHVMNEEIALAALVGDGRDDGDPDKIHDTHIRPVWTDDELYTIHADVDIAAAKAELQGTNTGANFGENYIYAEAIITAALYAREKYKGSGALDLYCTPHLLNVMLLARDLNGRRIYDSKADLAAALNVNAIHTIEQFEGKTRTTETGETKKLLGLFVNMADYQFGSTKGGEITRFEDFDMDFNKYKYMLETRLSGALTKLFSAIALEEPVTDATV